MSDLDDGNILTNAEQEERQRGRVMTHAVAMTERAEAAEAEVERLLAALSEAEAERDMLKKRPWVAGLEQHRARLAEAEAERDELQEAVNETLAEAAERLNDTLWTDYQNTLARLEALEGALERVADFDCEPFLHRGSPSIVWMDAINAIKSSARAALAQEHTEPQEA